MDNISNLIEKVKNLNFEYKTKTEKTKSEPCGKTCTSNICFC